LFDGKSLSGWQRNNGSANYVASEGMIVGTTSEGSPNSFLSTEKEYDDFEMEFDVKVDPELNSGVQIRSQTKDGPTGRGNGPQVEITQNVAGYIYGEGLDGGWRTPEERRKPHQIFKKGEWNHYKMWAKGPQIRVWTNGELIEDLTDEKIFATHPKGFIGLQVHGIKKGTGPYQVAWKDIKLRELE
jgi:hypothetical protein